MNKLLYALSAIFILCLLILIPQYYAKSVGDDEYCQKLKDDIEYFGTQRQFWLQVVEKYRYKKNRKNYLALLKEGERLGFIENEKNINNLICRIKFDDHIGNSNGKLDPDEKAEIVAKVCNAALLPVDVKYYIQISGSVKDKSKSKKSLFNNYINKSKLKPAISKGKILRLAPGEVKVERLPLESYKNLPEGSFKVKINIDIIICKEEYNSKLKILSVVNKNRCAYEIEVQTINNRIGKTR